MKNYIILYRKESLDNRIDLDIIEGNDASEAMFNWLNKDGGINHCSGYVNDSIEDEDVKLFESDYEKFRKKFYKSSPYFRD